MMYLQHDRNTIVARTKELEGDLTSHLERIAVLESDKKALLQEKGNVLTTSEVSFSAKCTAFIHEILIPSSFVNNVLVSTGSTCADQYII